MPYLKFYILRHAMGIAVAVFFALILNQYFSYTGEYWLPLSAFCVSQITTGTPLRHAILSSLMIFAALLAASLLLPFLAMKSIVWGILISLFFLQGYGYFLLRTATNTLYYPAIIFLIILAIAIFSSREIPWLLVFITPNRILDAAMGAGIGIACSLVFSMGNIDREFRDGIIPVLRAYAGYAEALTQKILSGQDNPITLADAKLKVEKFLQTPYPNWVYEWGFNPALKAGFRYFLIHVERISETLFAMHHLIRYPFDHALVELLSASIVKCMAKNQELFHVILTYLETGKIIDPQLDYVADVGELEEILQSIIPSTLELVDISTEYVYLVAFVRNLKDLRHQLLQLAVALDS